MFQMKKNSILALAVVWILAMIMLWPGFAQADGAQITTSTVKNGDTSVSVTVTGLQNESSGSKQIRLQIADSGGNAVGSSFSTEVDGETDRVDAVLSNDKGYHAGQYTVLLQIGTGEGPETVVSETFSVPKITPNLTLSAETVAGDKGRANIQPSELVLGCSNLTFGAVSKDNIEIKNLPEGVSYSVEGGDGSPVKIAFSVAEGKPDQAGKSTKTITVGASAFDEGPEDAESGSISFTWYIRDIYPVSYRYGTEIRTDEKVEGKALTLRGEGLFSEAGKYQSGWTRTEGSETVDYELGGKYEEDKALTLYPAWRDPKTYSIVYINGSEKITEEKIENVKKQLLGKDAFKKPGSTIKGWSKVEGSSTIQYQVDEYYTANEDIELYPVWGSAATYTVTYTNDSTVITQTKTEGTKLTLLGTDLFKKDNYTLIGWATAPNATEVKYKGGDPYEKDENLDLYPVWKENKQAYLVEYINGSEVKTQTKIEGEVLKLLDGTAFSRTGEILSGWTTSEGSGMVHYALGQNYTADAPLTLYPVWTPIPVTGISLSPTQHTFTKLGDSIHLNGSVIPPNAKVTAIGWSSSDSSVASVDGNGNVTAHKKGTAIITAETIEGHYKATCQINVEPAVPTLHWSFQKDTDRIGYKEYVILHLYVANRQSDIVELRRGSSRIYIQGAGGTTVRKTHTNVYEVTLDANGYADVFVMPQYNGSVTLTAQSRGTEKKSRTFTISGYPTMPQTGPDYSLIYIATALSGATLAAAVTLSFIRKKREQQV